MSDYVAIRNLFLNPHATYTLPDAAAVLGTTIRDLNGWIDVGEIELVETERGRLIPWAEVVSFAMDFWSQAVVEEALGPDLAEAIPELLRLADLEVRIPRMQVVTLERLAALDGETVSAVLARELRDFVSVHAEWRRPRSPRLRKRSMARISHSSASVASGWEGWAG
jgi:hypothetical protein